MLYQPDFLIKSMYNRIISKHYSLQNVLIQISSSNTIVGLLQWKKNNFHCEQKQWRIKSAFEIGRKTRHRREAVSSLSRSLFLSLQISSIPISKKLSKICKILKSYKAYALDSMFKHAQHYWYFIKVSLYVSNYK